MNKTKSITIIIVTSIVTIGIVVVATMYFRYQKPGDSNLAQQALQNTKQADLDAKSTPNSAPATIGPLLSLSRITATNELVSANCDLPVKQSCKLWAQITGTKELVLLGDTSKAIIESQDSLHTVYTWDLSSIELIGKYDALILRSYDKNSNLVGASQPSSLAGLK
jgi:hypothetical protein